MYMYFLMFQIIPPWPMQAPPVSPGAFHTSNSWNFLAIRTETLQAHLVHFTRLTQTWPFTQAAPIPCGR